VGRTRPRLVCWLALPLVLGACTDTAVAPADSAAADACVDDGEPFEGDTKLFIEHNATDEDTGVHALFGSDGLAAACLRAPDGTRLLAVEPAGQLGDLGLGDFFLESREPPADEYSIADLEADFP
jgi:hypothetical protein